MGSICACFGRRSGTVRLTDALSRRAIEDATSATRQTDVNNKNAWIDASEVSQFEEEEHEIRIEEEPDRDPSDIISLPIHRGRSSKKKFMLPRGESSDSVSEVALDSPLDDSSDSAVQGITVPSRRGGNVQIDLPPKKKYVEVICFF